MTLGLGDVVALAAGGLALGGLAQCAAGLLAARRLRAAPASDGPWPPISILKPLAGDEPLLEAALISFCDQDYPVMQLVCGVARADDAAVAVVERVRARFPAADIALVVDPTVHGPNRKVGNLVNMQCAAKHPLLVIADSDMHAAPDYLRRVAAALRQPEAGLATTLYVGLPARPTIPNMLGAAYINQNFATGALVGRQLGRQDCLGATMALTRRQLAAAGGLRPLAQFVADDAILGRRIRALGRRVALAATVPATTVDEAGFAALFRHELRWARTVRAVEPSLFILTFVQYPAFWTMLAAAAAGGGRRVLAAAALALLARALLGRAIEGALGARPTPLWLAPVRDTLSVAVGIAAYAGRRVRWRDQMLTTDADYATLHPEADEAPVLATKRS